MCYAGQQMTDYNPGRGLKQQLLECNGQEGTDACPGGYQIICFAGSAKGGCRTKNQGAFPSPDCSNQCYRT